LKDIVGEPHGPVLVAIPELFPDRYLRVTTGKEPALVCDSPSLQRYLKDSAGPVLGEPFLLVLVLIFRKRPQQANRKRRVASPVDAAKPLVHSDQDVREIVRLPVLILTEDQDPVAIGYGAAGVAELLDPPSSFRVEGLRVVAERMVTGGTPEYHRRGPNLAYQYLVVVFGPLVRSAKVEMVPETTDVVLIRMAVQERVDIETAFRISIQPIPELRSYVRGFIVGIVGRNAYVYIN